MSALQRVEKRCVKPGQWVIEGWSVRRVARKRWKAIKVDGRWETDEIFGSTLEEVCGQILDRN